MKIRNGFVSNSSTSSFIIAFKKEINKCPHCNRSDPSILDLFSGHSEDYRNYVSKINNASFFDLFGADEKTIKRAKDKVDFYLKEGGWEVAELSISNHDDNARSIFYGEVDKGNVIIIHNYQE